MKKTDQQKESERRESTPGVFVTTSGKKVHFEALHIEISTLGFLEGSPLIRRENILRRLSQTIRGKFGYSGLLLREPPAGPLPKYAFFASFHCYRPIHEGAVKTFSPYESVQDHYPEARAAIKDLAGKTTRKPSYIFVNNRLEGSALGTIAGVFPFEGRA